MPPLTSPSSCTCCLHLTGRSCLRSVTDQGWRTVPAFPGCSGRHSCTPPTEAELDPTIPAAQPDTKDIRLQQRVKPKTTANNLTVSTLTCTGPAARPLIKAGCHSTSWQTQCSHLPAACLHCTTWSSVISSSGMSNPRLPWPPAYLGLQLLMCYSTSHPSSANNLLSTI